ncbi:MAG: aspartate--tRNA ligase [Oscillospiraceae bacterium]|jgi:aspartyl-tRNA synthetase|nr:aspartate--tRNA ligase [Oscillospiraceae bacterium]
MNMYRTHTCGQLRPCHVPQSVTLAGWVDTVRDHGGIVFADLRDHYGVTQLVIHDEDAVSLLKSETVICAKGQLRLRGEDTVNPKIATGEVEVLVSSVEVLGPVMRPLPFDIAESARTREEVRLRYRYLDLRNPAVHTNILLRANITRYLRAQMEELGFVEIHTPILTSSSPEGARDYLVPSRKHHGMFYALPQAPQQFKQLLMVSGFDKYYQIAPCFRDEDARADRSPGEFYQLDFEMAFATQEDVFAVVETVLYNTFTRFTPKRVSPAPFRRIPYAECMLRYGTDKPDLRNPLIIEDLTAFFADVDFAPFHAGPVRAIAAPGCASKPKSFFEKLHEYATGELGMKGLGYISVFAGMELKGPIVKFLSADKRDELTVRLGLKEDDVLFFVCDLPHVADSLAGKLRAELGARLGIYDEDSFEMCFVTDYPMYGRNEDTGAIEFTHNPFSMPQGGIEALRQSDPLDIKAYQYDIVCNGVELSSGAVRNHRPDIMLEAFAIAGYTREDIESKFPALFAAFHHGAPPHAGMAPGLDRIVMLISGQENIREVTAFPMNSAAQDTLMGAPGPVTERQLREAHIKIR